MHDCTSNRKLTVGQRFSLRRVASGIGAGCDLLSHEATFAAGMEEKAGIAQHSTAHMAGTFARKLGAQALVLTHFSGRYDSVTAPRRGDRPQRPRNSEDDMDVEAFDSANVNSLLQEVCSQFVGRVWGVQGGRKQHCMAQEEWQYDTP